jgi:photosystem II stability/assembly factor-like uncharacterized protein
MKRIRQRTSSVIAIAVMCFAIAVVMMGLVFGCARSTTKSVAKKTVGPPCRNAKRDWQQQYRGGWIDSLIVSSSSSSRIYATKPDTSLYIGDGVQQFRWRRVAKRTPGGLAMSLGNHGDTLLTLAGSVFESINEGRHWSELVCSSDGIVNDVAYEVNNPRVMYAAIGTPMDTTSEPPEFGGIYRSLDGGRKWGRLADYYPASVKLRTPSSDYAYMSALSVAVSPVLPKVVYLGTAAGGIFVSRDGGESWLYNPIENARDGAPKVYLSNIEPSGGRGAPVWALTSLGAIYRGDAFGRHWTRITTHTEIEDIVPDTRIQKIALAVPAHGAVLRTVDKGRHWTSVVGLPHPDRSIGVVFQPLTDTYYAWTRDRVYRSSDHGLTWKMLPPLPG